MTNKTISLIVEGYGEEDAFPNLMNRLLPDHFQRYDIFTNIPKNAKGRYQLTQVGGFEKYVNHCVRIDKADGILVLLDADDDCPINLAKGFYMRVKQMNIQIPVSFVCAKCEYEAWFLASIDVLIQKGYLKEGASYPIDKIEEKRGVKEWLNANMPAGRRYRETIDQLKMTQCIKFKQTLALSRSFRRLEHAIAELLHAIDSSTITITPSF
ncbi:MAG: DUF4276 family protein [bacterium]|nr:DUF4276 family protein [bacterium]